MNYGGLFFEFLQAIGCIQLCCASIITTSHRDFIVVVAVAACTSSSLWPRNVELRIEGWIIFDRTCSFAKQLGEAITRDGVFEAIIPQTLQIANDERILVVGGVFVAVARLIWVGKVWVIVGLGCVNRSAAGNVTVPPAFIL